MGVEGGGEGREKIPLGDIGWVPLPSTAVPVEWYQQLSLSLSLSLCVCVCVSVSVSLPRLLALSLSGFVSYLSLTPSSLVSFFLSIGEHGRAEGPERGQSKVGKIRQSASNTALHYLNAFGTLPAHCPTPTLCYTMLAVWRPPGPTGRLLPLPDSVLQ